MIRLAALVVGVGSAAQDNSSLTNLVALIVALGTLAAGIVAYLRLRQDRPKVIAEIAGMSETRLRDELNTAWTAVDRLRRREDDLEKEVGTAQARIRELEATCQAQATRIVRLERIVGPGV